MNLFKFKEALINKEVYSFKKSQNSINQSNKSIRRYFHEKI